MVKGWDGVRGGFSFEYQWGQKNEKRKKNILKLSKKEDVAVSNNTLLQKPVCSMICSPINMASFPVLKFSVEQFQIIRFNNRFQMLKIQNCYSFFPDR